MRSIPSVATSFTLAGAEFKINGLCNNVDGSFTVKSRSFTNTVAAFGAAATSVQYNITFKRLVFAGIITVCTLLAPFSIVFVK